MILQWRLLFDLTACNSLQGNAQPAVISTSPNECTRLTFMSFSRLSGLAAYDLSQEKSKSAKEGDKVSILCTAENDKYYISWYQQKSGGPPEFLLCNDNRASGLPGRFTYTDSGNQDYLNIEGVRAEDQAVYYCACLNCGGAQCYSPAEPLYKNLLWSMCSEISEMT